LGRVRSDMKILGSCVFKVIASYGLFRGAG